MQILSLIQIVVSFLLIMVILLQKTGADGLSGIGGSNMGVVTTRAAANFLTKTTVLLAIVFMVNAIILANLSNRKSSKVGDLNSIDSKVLQEKQGVPIAK